MEIISMCVLNEEQPKEILNELAMSKEHIATLADAYIGFNDGLLSIIYLAEQQSTIHEQPRSLEMLLDEALRNAMDVCSVEAGCAEIRFLGSESIFCKRGNVLEACNRLWEWVEEAFMEKKTVIQVECAECKENSSCGVKGQQYSSVIIFPLANPNSRHPIGHLSLLLRPEEKNIRAESVRIAEVICRISAGMIYSRLYEDKLRSEAEEMVTVARSFSHGIGRFLTTMKRWIESWPESEKPKGKRTIFYLEEEHDNRLILLKLMRGLINKADVQEGLLRLNGPVLNWIIDFVADSYSLIAETEGKKIHVNLPNTELAEPSSALVNYCAGLIELVVTNLVSNAVEHAEKNVTITFKMAALEAGKSPQFIIIVEDDGTGFDPEIREQIFGIDDYTAQEIMAKEDQGLGLPLSLMVAHRYLDGDIVCEENTPGARLVFKFPLESEKLEA